MALYRVQSLCAPPEIEEKRSKMQLKYTQAILRAKKLAEVFILAIDELTQDLPANDLRKVRLLMSRAPLACTTVIEPDRTSDTILCSSVKISATSFQSHLQGRAG